MVVVRDVVVGSAGSLRNRGMGRRHMLIWMMSVYRLPDKENKYVSEWDIGEGGRNCTSSWNSSTNE